MERNRQVNSSLYFYTEIASFIPNGNSIYRWIKFEEDVEEGGNRWSKPHVATLSLHALFELRSFVLNGTVILDADAHSLEEVTDLMLDNMIGCSVIPFDCKDKVNFNPLSFHLFVFFDSSTRIPLYSDSHPDLFPIIFFISPAF